MGKDSNPDGVDIYPADQHDLASYEALSEALGQLEVPVLLHAANPHERLFMASLDGTGNSLFKDDPENHSVVAKLYSQIERAKPDRIAAGYVEGTFTQDNFFTRNRDGITGFTFDQRVETAYYQLCIQAKKWIDQDPQAQIRVAGVGFSRGAEEVAALTRMVEERGILDPTGALITRNDDGLVTNASYEGPPLVPPGATRQAVLLFDPVATGVKDEDRRMAKSVVSGVQITAEDERRDQFASTNLLPPGFSEGNRFLNFTTGGSHSDIGDTYLLNGLGTRSFNAGVDYLNALTDRPFLHKRALPDPSHDVVHRSDQHLWGLYTTFGYREDGIRDRHRDLAPAELCRTGAARDCTRKDPIDPALEAGLERRGANPGAVPVAAALEPPGRGPGASRLQGQAPSALDSLIERLSRGATEQDDRGMRSATADYMASPLGRAFADETAHRTQRADAREQQLLFEAQQANALQAHDAPRVRVSP